MNKGVFVIIVVVNTKHNAVQYMHAYVLYSFNFQYEQRADGRAHIFSLFQWIENELHASVYIIKCTINHT